MTKILIVDDEAKIREMIEKYARHEGFETDHACDGMEAVEKCEVNSYDLVVMDIMMPNLDGFSAVKEITQFKSMTGSTDLTSVWTTMSSSRSPARS